MERDVTSWVGMARMARDVTFGAGLARMVGDSDVVCGAGMGRMMWDVIWGRVWWDGGERDRDLRRWWRGYVEDGGNLI